MQAISLSGSFCQEIAILYIVSKTLLPVIVLLQEARDGIHHTLPLPELSRALNKCGLPASLTQHREIHTKKPPNYASAAV